MTPPTSDLRPPQLRGDVNPPDIPVPPVLSGQRPKPAPNRRPTVTGQPASDRRAEVAGEPRPRPLKALLSDLNLAKLALPEFSRSGSKPKIGGVAPAVHPKTTWDRFREGRLLERRGFIPLSPARAKRRHRILPRTVIGISFMLLALAVGAAFAGAGFYAYYDNRLAANEQEVARFVEGFDEQFVDASESLNELRGESLEQIRQELQPLGEYVTDRNGVVDLPARVGSSVYQLRTANEQGATVAGSAAAVAKHQGGTAFVTSYTLVKSGTITPGPGIELIKGDEKVTATLWSWDPDRDLALVVVDADIPRLEFADATELTNSLGARVFAVSGTGGQGATASPGTVLDRSQVGLQHTAAIGELFNGGPLVTSGGKLVGIASTSYAPLGFAGGDVRFAPDLTGLCSRLLNCADPTDPETGEGSGG